MIFSINVNHGERKFNVNALSFDHALNKANKICSVLNINAHHIETSNELSNNFDSALPLIKTK